VQRFSKFFARAIEFAQTLKVPQFDSQDDDLEYYVSSVLKMAGRKVFRTQNGYVGLGPAGLLDGDILVVFFGASLPYILRPRDGGVYEFVGEAYCEGIMDGEALQTDYTEENFSIV
jgi:hypothetical protein